MQLNVNEKFTDKFHLRNNEKCHETYQIFDMIVELKKFNNETSLKTQKKTRKLTADVIRASNVQLNFWYKFIAVFEKIIIILSSMQR